MTQSNRYIHFDIRTPVVKPGEKAHNMDDMVDQRLAKLRPMFPNIKVMKRDKTEEYFDIEAGQHCICTTYHVDLGETHDTNDLLKR